ncbi:hypothetical protein PAI11_10350 [Patulibacter medicamentivorans]|uniref:Lipoprotein n=1 Tax=Patulibacter medicamentivorans TaxID=1097667 RepID=H0E2M2_9ACTN|nr:hypothetical protein [Patulibacter medicamentivorans]EHN12073.1 hypothetical protein PAI11_10350 [Patulibacter medicamentivorans]
MIRRRSPTPRLRGPRVATAVAGAAALALGGCTTTQELSAQRAKELSDIGSQHEPLVRIGRATPGVRLGRPTLLRGSEGAAVAIEVRNEGDHALIDLPIGVRVRRGKASLYTNRTAGLDRELLRVVALRPGERLAWVNDQLPADAGRGRVTANPGRARTVPAARIPRLRVSGLHPGREDGRVTASGRVRNDGRVGQANLVVFVTAERGGRVVAAGAAEIERLAPGASESFVAFLVGDATGAQLRAAAPPTVLAKK